MLKPLLKFSHRTIIRMFEAAVVLSIIVSFCFAAFMWRVSQGPMHIGWAKGYVEETLSHQTDDLKVAFDDMVFSWPDFKGPFLLDLTGLHVQKGAGESNTLTIKEASIGLSRGALLIGLIRPVSVIIKAPSLELVRGGDGHLNLFIADKELKVDEEAAAKQLPNEEIATLFKDMALRRNGSLLARLRQFEIRNASVAVRDHEFGLSWYLTNLNFLIQKQKDGVSATVNIPLPGGQKEGADIAVDVAYRTESDDFRGIAHIREVNPYIISRFLPVPDALAGQNLYFTGDIESLMDKDFLPTHVTFSGAIPDGQIDLPEEFDNPITLKNIAITSEYKSEDKKLSISNLSGEIGGIAFGGSGEATYDDTSMSMPITLNVESVKLEQIPPLFPKSEQDGEAYDWLSRKIEGGDFTNVALKMELAATKTRNEELQRDQWDVHVPKLVMDYDFTGAKVKYSETLTPVDEASGHGTLDLGAQTLEVTNGTGKLGEIVGTDVSVLVTDLMTAGAGTVTIKTKAKGPMASALDYIASEPINMGKDEIGLDPAKVKGTIEADVEVSLPTVHDVPKEDVKVNINGTLSELNIPDIVSGLPMSGGPLTLATKEGGFTIKGNAKLDGRDTKIDWDQFFEHKGHPYSMRVAASVAADKELRNHFGVELDDYISGTMPVDVIYTNMGDGTADVDVKADLAPVKIYIDPFKYEKPAGAAGSLSLEAYLKNDVLQKLTGVTIKAKDLSVSNATIGFAPHRGKKADLDNGVLKGATIGKTTADVDFNVGKDEVMAVNVKSSVFDLVPFLTDTAPANIKPAPAVPEKKKPMRISLNAPTMLGKNNQTAKSTRSVLAMDEDGDITQIQYDGAIGKGKLMVRFTPDETGKRVFRLQTDDAGAVLYTFGLYENVVGGTLRIYGEPKKGDNNGNIYGSMRMENFRVVKAPALARLLSLMSLGGVGELLNNQGLVFSKLESGFEWRFRKEGNLLIIKDGKTSGSSIGLTFSGVVDRGKKTTDVAGTIIPMTEINSFLAKIPLVGDLLGGAGGLIAATYSIKGPTSDPNVSVNPLSVLAPGIIRRILFEGGYESKIPDDSDEDAPKAKVPAAVAPPANASRTAQPGNTKTNIGTAKPAAKQPARTAQPKTN